MLGGAKHIFSCLSRVGNEGYVGFNSLQGCRDKEKEKVEVVVCMPGERYSKGF